MRLDGDVVMEFSEKPEIQDHWINGGFFFFQRDFSLIFPCRKAACWSLNPWCGSLATEKCAPTATAGSGIAWIRNATGSI
jgi:hypothetical protein